MIGRLHYATIAISIMLVAILLGVSLVFSNESLKPHNKNFLSVNLSKQAIPTELQEIDNPDFLENDPSSDQRLNRLYTINISDSELPQNPILSVKPGHIFQSTLYQVSDNRLELIDRQGRFDFKRAPEFMGYAKVYDLSGLEADLVYLHVQHIRELQPQIELWDYSLYNRLDNQYNQLFTAIFFGIFLLLLVNFFFFLIIRRKEYLLYIFYNSTFLIFLMTSSGYIYQFPMLAPLAGNMNATYAVFALSMYALYTFSQEFMSTAQQAKPEHIAINVFKGLYLFLFALPFFISPIPHLMVQVINLLVVLAVPLYAWLVIKLMRNNNRQAFFFALAFALLILAGVCRVLTTFSILPETFIFNHGFAIASLLEATIFTLGLADRVLQLKTQRDTLQKESLEHSQAYELQKDFSTLLNSITQKLHMSKSQEYESMVVNSFLDELGKKVTFVSAAAVYQMDGKLHVYSKTEFDRNKFKKVIRNNSLQIKRLCDIKQPERLEDNKPYQNIFVIPVEMRRHEWSCLMLEVPKDFDLTASMLDFLQHYATELIRCLLNIESLRLIKSKAETDDLTRLLNRGAVLEYLDKSLIKAQRADEPLSIAFIDVDNFKQVNDTFGHEAGDRCLKNLAELLIEELPDNCIIGRYGGDEFLVILPNMSKTTSSIYFSNVSERIIPLIVDKQSCRYTLSIGISSLKSNTKDSLQLIREADKALYVSKNEGKNQINLA